MTKINKTHPNKNNERKQQKNLNNKLNRNDF